MTAFKRGDRWVAKFVLNKKQIWVPDGPWRTKGQAREAERRHRDFLEARISSETCASFGERWLEEWPRPSTSTRRLYAAAVKRFIEHFGPTPLNQVDRMSARAWALTVPRNLSRVIGTMYEDARDVNLVESNPFDRMNIPGNKRKKQVQNFEMAGYRALIEGCEVLDAGYQDEMRAMIALAAWSGIRQGELYGLQWQDVGEEEMLIARSRKLDGGLGLPKNGLTRIVPLLPPARVFDLVPRRPDDKFVFHSPRGRPLLKGTHAWTWQRVKAAAHSDWRWHDLRHFCATQLLERGFSHFDVSVMLGHTDGGALVMQRYGHPSEAAARRRLLHGFEDASFDIGRPEVDRTPQRD